MMKFVFLAVVAAIVFLTGCGSTPPLLARLKAEQNQYDIKEITTALEQYPMTPFTLSLIGEAPVPDDGNVPDLSVATDVAYCAFLFSRDGYQTRIGSDFSRNALSVAAKFKNQLATLVFEQKHADYLLMQAESLYYAAIDYGRYSSDPLAVMNFNFGGHKGSCSASLDTISAD